MITAAARSRPGTIGTPCIVPAAGVVPALSPWAVERGLDSSLRASRRVMPHAVPIARVVTSG